MNDFWKRVRSWNGFRQDQFVDVRQIDEWTVRFETPDGLVGIYDGLRHITRVVFNNFDEHFIEEYGNRTYNDNQIELARALNKGADSSVREKQGGENNEKKPTPRVKVGE